MRLYTPYSLSRGAPSATRSRFRNDVIVTCFFAGFGKTMILFRLVETEGGVQSAHGQLQVLLVDDDGGLDLGGDRKSTRLNSSHLVISYAVFCLKKKKKELQRLRNDLCYAVEARLSVREALSTTC